MAIECRYCNHCKDEGRSEAQGRNYYGRKHYYCKHPEATLRDKSRSGFVGYGDNTTLSPLQVKTSPRWCPRKEAKDGSNG